MKNKIDYKWIIKVVIVAFVLACFFTLISETIVPNINIFLGIIITILIVLIGVCFDMIGVAVTTASEKPFHSMASKKIKGSKTSIWLIKNADKVSSFCCDVVGDICGIISGSTGAVIALTIHNKLHINSLLITIIIMALISTLTIGGKAVEKSIAINNSEKIVKCVSNIISLIKREK